MKCLVCGNLFNEPRTLKDLFRTKKFYICLSCLKLYPIKINYSTIPLDNHILDIVSLFEKDKKINYDAFFETYCEIYKKVKLLNDDKIIIFENKVYLSNDFIEEFSYISTLLDKDIIILTNVFLP